MILQEVYKDDPWKMLVGCILLNQTSRAQVDGVRDELFETYPHPADMAVAGPELTTILRPLGFQNRRAHTLRQFSHHWIAGSRICDEGAWPSALVVNGMYGVGKYALDSYKIFVLGMDIRPDQVEDKVLKRYLELREVV